MQYHALLVGAGFSAWPAGLPVAAQLFDFAIDPIGPREVRKLAVVRAAWESWSGDHPASSSEQFVAAALAGEAHVRDAVLWCITRRLSEPYIWYELQSGRLRRHVLMIDENRKYSRPGVRRTQRFLILLYPYLEGIVTTNYDLLLEYALGTKLFNYGEPREILDGRGPYPLSRWRQPVTLQGRLPLAKLHGSISWDGDSRYTEGRRGLTGNALIVAPGPEKSPPAALAREWGLSGRILESTRHLVVFGFGFNPYDEALLSHLKEHGRGIERVTVIDVSPNLQRAQTVWPNAEMKTVLPPEADEAIADWVRVILTPQEVV